MAAPHFNIYDDIKISDYRENGNSVQGGEDISTALKFRKKSFREVEINLKHNLTLCKHNDMDLWTH